MDRAHINTRRERRCDDHIPISRMLVHIYTHHTRIAYVIKPKNTIVFMCSIRRSNAAQRKVQTGPHINCGRWWYAACGEDGERERENKPQRQDRSVSGDRATTSPLHYVIRHTNHLHQKGSESTLNRTLSRFARQSDEIFGMVDDHAHWYSYFSTTRQQPSHTEYPSAYKLKDIQYTTINIPLFNVLCVFRPICLSFKPFRFDRTRCG